MSDLNSELLELLAQLDIPPNEALTYAALLPYGSASIRKVAAATGINRGTTYEALKKLTLRGLVSVKRTGDKREQYSAESPERIYDLIRDKRRDLLDAANEAKELVPNILANYAAPSGRPLVRYYEGDEGVATILKDVLHTCQQLAQPQYYAYSSNTVRRYLYRNYPQFTERRIADGISVKVIGVGGGSHNEATLAERKQLPNLPSTQAESATSYTIIYGHKVAVISITRDNIPYGVVIEDAGATAMQRLLFEQLWSTL
jgi:sugar-specific transcriptional regulator TrmB